MLRFLSILFFTVLFVGTSITDAEAQYRSRKKRIKHRFNAGLMLGMSLSQIGGDNYTGFDKAGIRIGAKGSMYINSYTDLVVGFLYNQKGSALSILNPQRGSVIDLDYMEVPVLLSFRVSKKDRNKSTLQAGFSYGRLINYDIQELIRNPQIDIYYSDIAKQFNSNEFNLVLGWDYFINQNIGLGFIHSFQVNRLYENPIFNNSDPVSLMNLFNNNATSEVLSMRNYQVVFHIVYNIF